MQSHLPSYPHGTCRTRYSLPRDSPEASRFLTQGTAHDIITNQYVNPSDWQDRPLTHFNVSDHIPIMRGDDEQSGRTWCYTLGLSKFGCR